MTSDDLIERWIGGDATAGEALCARYLESARRFALRIGGRELDPDEIAAEALAEGIEGLRGGKRPDRFTKWLHGVIRNLVRTRIKERRRPAPGVPPPAAPDGELTRMAGRELGPLLDGLLPALPEGSREVIELFRRGRTREQIAEELGVPLATVHARFLRAFRTMREGLSRHFTTLAVAARRAPVSWAEIRRLRPSFREAMIARHLEELGPADAARKLAIPVETLEARLRTAYEQLQCDARADFSGARDEFRTESPPPRS